MEHIIFIQVSYLIVCVLEAWLEQVVILQKHPVNYLFWDKAEHFRSGAYSFAVGTLLCLPIFVYVDWKAATAAWITLLPIRRVFFDNPLKLLRTPARKIKVIEGNGPVDKFSRRLFKANGGWYELLACAVFIGLINYLFKTIK